MHNVINVKSEELFLAVAELLQQDRKVRLTVTGDSMLPFLRENTDSVELSRASFKELRFGQIILIRRSNGQYILHRLILKGKSSFYIAGDAQNWVEGPIRPEQLVAVVTKVWRGDKPVPPSGLLWQTLSFIWWIRLIVRYLLTRPCRAARRIFNTLFGR